ncbi:MAG: tRNA (guanine(10)-N(2))-dimethyltransferase [Candidatus Altiarchaeota archaeon]
MMDVSEFSEGSVRLKIPAVERLLRKNPVFFNPLMELNRDISVASCRLLKPNDFCDALAGSGARGFRVAREAGVDVTLVDMNSTACEFMEENAKLNKLKVNVVNDDCTHFLSGRKFDYIDVDPFGPPVRYLDSAIRACRKRSFLGVAATDTSALCGTYPRACKRKYDSVSLRTDCYDELGLRILLGFIARSAVRYDYGVSFLFSHCTRHYFRTYAELNRGRSHVRKSQDSLGFVQHCFKCLWRGYRKLEELEQTCKCGSPLSTAGPLWTAEFADPVFCGNLIGELESGSYGTKSSAVKLISAVSDEQPILTPYYDLHKIAKRERKPAPARDAFFKKVTGGGHRITRTHFSDLGIRSDADVDEIAGYLGKL